MFRYVIVAMAVFLGWKTWGAEFVANNQDNMIGTTANTVQAVSIKAANEVTSWSGQDWKLIGVAASVMVLLSTVLRFKRWLRNRGATMPGLGAFFPDAGAAMVGSENGALKDVGKVRVSVRKRLMKGQRKGWTRMNLQLGRTTALVAESIAAELKTLGYNTEIVNYRNGKKTLKVNWRPTERAAPLA